MIKYIANPKVQFAKAVGYNRHAHPVTQQGRWLQMPMVFGLACKSWAEALAKIARIVLTTKLDWNWSSFQLANSAPPLGVTDSAIAPSARMPDPTCVVRGPPSPFQFMANRSGKLPAPRPPLGIFQLALRQGFATPLGLVSQRSPHNAPIFRLLLKVAVNGTHQCELLNF